MANIVSKRITGEILTLAELSKGFLINGQYYDKRTLSPVPFDFNPIHGFWHRLTGANSLICTGSEELPRYNSNFVGSVVDSIDPDITYLFSYRWTSAIMISKVEEKNGRMKILGENTQVHSWGGNYSKIEEVLYQDENFIYGIVSSDTNAHGFFRFNKHSLQFENLRSLGAYNRVVPIKREGDRMYLIDSYFAATSGYRMRIWEWRFKENLTTVILDTGYFSDNHSSWNGQSQRVGIMDIIEHDLISKNDADYYDEIIVMTSETINSTNIGNHVHIPVEHKFRIYHNQSNAEHVSRRIPFELNQENIANFKITEYKNSSFDDYNYFCKENDLGEKSLFISPIPNSDNHFKDDEQGIIKFALLKDEDGEYQIIRRDVFATSGNTVRGVLFDKNKDIVYLHKRNQSIEMWRHRKITNDYVKVRDLPLSDGIMLDSNENAWIVNSNGLSWFSKENIPVDIVMESANQEYMYVDSNISTYIEVGAKDLNGSYMSAKLRLSINGDGYFNETDNKVLEMTTDSTGVQRVFITITGPGRISVVPTFLMDHSGGVG